VLESGQQMFVNRNLRETGTTPRIEIGLESLPLEMRIGEFVVAVGKLETFDKDLETLGQRQVAGPHPGQRGL